VLDRDPDYRATKRLFLARRVFRSKRNTATIGLNRALMAASQLWPIEARTMQPETEILSESRAAEFFNKQPRTLANWRALH
jgi:hypothetical protein